MSYNYYLCNPDLNGYFRSLPPFVRNTLSESGVEIATLGELKQCADHIMLERSTSTKDDR